MSELDYATRTLAPLGYVTGINTKLLPSTKTKYATLDLFAWCGRMEWDEPGPTITTQFFGLDNWRFGHPKQNRAISLHKGALLQAFPEQYSFVPKGEDIQMSSISRLIGNAVPVKLGAAIGRCIIAHVEKYNER